MRLPQFEAKRNKLLEQLPWLQEFGNPLINNLIRAGVQTPQDLEHLKADDFAQIRGVGEHKLALLRAAQERLRSGIDTPPKAKVHSQAAASCDDDLLDYPLEWVLPTLGVYDNRFINSLLVRAKLQTVRDLLSMSEEEFMAVRGVGYTQCVMFRRLKVILLERLNKTQTEFTSRVHSTASEADTTSRTSETLMQDEEDVLSDLMPSASWASLGDYLRDLCMSQAGRYRGEARSRNIQIWIRRHGLENGSYETLTRLSAEFGITRQRVRQIEQYCTRHMSAALANDPHYGAILGIVRQAFSRCLGIAVWQDFSQLLSDAAGWSKPPSLPELNALAKCLRSRRSLLLKPYEFDIMSHGDTYLVMNKHACERLWHHAGTCARRAVEGLKSEEHVLDFAYRVSESLSASLQCLSECDTGLIPSCGAKTGRVRLPVAYVKAALLSVAPECLEGETVHDAISATLRNGRRKVDVVRAALQKIGHPVHYTELADFIRQHSRHLKQVTERSVHACLTTYSDFVLTEHLGVYGLCEWNVERYKTVGYQIEEFLSSRGRPVALQEIESVLTREGVPIANITAAITQQRFIRYEDGTVGLRRWEEEEGKNAYNSENEQVAELKFIDDDGEYIVLE